VQKLIRSPRFSGHPVKLELARVLLVHGELVPRLALRTILQAGGYAVDVAASASEAFLKMDEGTYDLVLIDAQFERGRSGADLLAYARVKAYHPATAVITSQKRKNPFRTSRSSQRVSIYTEDVSHLLESIAELIGVRASRRYRPLRQAV